MPNTENTVETNDAYLLNQTDKGEIKSLLLYGRGHDVLCLNAMSYLWVLEEQMQIAPKLS